MLNQKQLNILLKIVQDEIWYNHIPSTSSLTTLRRHNRVEEFREIEKALLDMGAKETDI